MENKLKILIVAPCFHAVHIGGDIVEDGIGGYISFIADKLARIGYQVDVVATMDSTISGRCTMNGIRLFHIGKYSGSHDNFKTMLPWMSYRSTIVKLHKENHYYVIYNNAQHVPTIAWLCRLGPKIVHYSHGNPDNYFRNQLKDLSNLTIIACGATNERLWNKSDHKFTLLRNDLCTSLENEKSDLKRPFISTEVLVVSRVFRTKGILELLDLATSLPDVNFTLLGSRCNITPKLGVETINVKGRLYSGSTFEEAVSEAIKDIPNLTWMNENESDRYSDIEVMRNWDGWMMSLSPEEAGATVSIESKVFGIPFITLNFENSNNVDNITCRCGNGVTRNFWNKYCTELTNDIGDTVAYAFKCGVVVNQDKYYPDKSPEIIREALLNFYLDRSDIVSCMPLSSSHLNRLSNIFEKSIEEG